MRIDKLISDMGLASRRECATLAKKGQLTVDGKPVKQVSLHIDPEKQTVVFCGKRVEYRKFTYIMLNKPEGFVSATDDPSLPYVTELLPEELRRRGLFPAGRLDRDTVGLMLLTNDGALAHSLLSPRHHVEKRYLYSCAEPLADGAEELFSRGVTLADGYECKSAVIEPSPDRMKGAITLTEGKYHQIKRMIASTSNRVTFLERVSFGGIALDRSLGRGEWRYLTDSEIDTLRAQSGQQ